MRGDACKVCRVIAGPSSSKAVCNNWYMLCCRTMTATRYSSQASTMLSVKYRYSEPIADPAPRTASDEDIRKAQAIREALRRQLLGRTEPKYIPSWTVGAD